jgi:hypothetical protein
LLSAIIRHVAVGVADPDLALGPGASVSDRTDPQAVGDQVVAQAVEVLGVEVEENRLLVGVDRRWRAPA